MNDIEYINNQSKIDILSVKLSNKMNQLLIGENMPINHLRYITWFHKLDANVYMANQQRICIQILDLIL